MRTVPLLCITALVLFIVAHIVSVNGEHIEVVSFLLISMLMFSMAIISRYTQDPGSLWMIGIILGIVGCVVLISLLFLFPGIFNYYLDIRAFKILYIP